MPRYPNYDSDARQFNGSAADAIAPEQVEVKTTPSTTSDEGAVRCPLLDLGSGGGHNVAHLTATLSSTVTGKATR